MTARRILLATILLSLGLGSSSADQDPNVARGFSPGSAFDFAELDNISLFNGNLVVTLPLGPTYPVGDALSYNLSLIYNSNVWDYETRTQTNPPGSFIQAIPRRSSNAGLGWQVSLGGVLYGPQHVGSGNRWRFEGDDGSDHVFFHSLHVAESSQAGGRDCLFTRDGSYLRLCAGGGGQWTVESPSGHVRTFEPVPYTQGVHAPWDFKRYRLNRMEDRFGNWVAVSYNGLAWTITDSVQREHTVDLVQVFIDGHLYRLVSGVHLERFGPGEDRAFYELKRQTRSIRRSCKDTDDETSSTVSVPLLTELKLPEEPGVETGSFRMGAVADYHNLSNCAAGVVQDLPGVLAGIELPTGGRLEWDFQEYSFASRGNPPTLEDLAVQASAGVRERRTLNRSGGCDYGSTAACRWLYTPGRDTATPAGNRYTIVRSPLGDETKSYFREQFLSLSSANGFQGWDYGLPYTDTQSTTALDGTVLYLSQQIFDGSASGSPVRSIWVRYERDKLIPFQNRSHLRDWHDSNRRPVAQRTLYHDDLSGGVPRFTEARSSDYDGLGHYRTQVSAGNFVSASAPSTRTDTTRFNPGRGTYAIDQVTNNPIPGAHSYQPLLDNQPWILSTYDRAWMSEGGTSYEARFCFQETTGRLKRERRMVSTALNARDVILDHSRNRVSASDIRYQTKVYGGDVQDVTTSSSWCSVSPATTNPTYRTRDTYLYGAMARRERLKGGGAVFLVESTHTVDPHTSLVAATTDASGLQTTFDYDLFGRLTWIKPQTGGGSWTQIDYDAATPSALAVAKLFSWPNGTSSGTALKEIRYTYDPFGRLAAHEIKVPGHGGWQAVRTTYDALGNKVAVSERGSGFATTHHNYDPFGRPREIRLPDYTPSNGHYLGLSYNGTRLASRSVSVATSIGGAESRSTTTHISDFQGRLWRVKEPSGTGGTEVNTDYGFDPAGRIKSLRIRGPVDQWRFFTYDGRGFLLSENHPESGTTSYAEYDALGNAGRVTTGPSQGQYDLRFSFDEAERLVEVSEWRGTNGSMGRVLKELTYGSGTSAADRSGNKVKTAVRHNYVPHPNLGHPVDVIVTETYTYGGVGGRPSRRVTELNTGPKFDQGWAYDDLGQVTSTTYPTCEHPATCNAAGNRHPRTVSRNYAQGFLTAIPGFASSIRYHTNGLLAEVDHTNSLTYGRGLDPHGMSRPASLWVAQNGQFLPFAPGQPTLAGQAVPLPYEYDGAGNVERWADERYRYDRLSRILETDNDGVENQSYAYDPYGNLTSITTNGSVRLLSVDVATNRLSGVPYDASGNQTQWGNTSYKYDSFNMMWHRGGLGAHDTYAYTADDERIWAVDATNPNVWKERVFLRDLDGALLRTFQTQTGGINLAWEQDYIRRDGQPLATVRAEAGETTYHFHPNHLGTPLLTSSSSGSPSDFVFLFSTLMARTSTLLQRTPSGCGSPGTRGTSMGRDQLMTWTICTHDSAIR